MPATQSSASPPPHAPTRTVLTFGSVGMPIAGLILIILVYLPRHYVSLGVSLIAVAGAFSTVRLIDVFFDPFVALLMDRTKTAIGRYRPWMLGGACLVMLGTYKLLMPVGPVDGEYLIVWLVITFAGLSILNLGIASWSALLATAYHDRSRVYTLLSAQGLLGALLIAAMPIVSGGRIVPGMKNSMPALGWVLLIAVPVTVFISTGFTSERALVISDKPRLVIKDYFALLGRPSLLLLIVADFVLALGIAIIGPIYVYFMHDVKHFTVPHAGLLLLPFMGAGLAGAPFFGRLARRIGKHRAVQLGCVWYALAQISLLVLPNMPPHYGALDALPIVLAVSTVGFASCCFTPLLRAMAADVADEVKLCHGADMTSLVFSMVTTTSKIGSSLSVAVIFPLLSLVHYDGAEGAVNTAGGIRGLASCFVLVPLFFLLIGAVVLVGYKLDERRHGEILRALALEDRDPPVSGGEPIPEIVT
jgi:GPH family glycoside/pentoside/hexuronide:cation symporter